MTKAKKGAAIAPAEDNTNLIPASAHQALVRPDLLFTDEVIEEIVGEIEKHALSLVPGDMEDEDDRGAVKSMARKVASSKVAIDDIGKEYVAELKKRPGEIDALRKKARDRLDALKVKVLAPLTAWEDERKRIEQEEADRLRREREEAEAARERELAELRERNARLEEQQRQRDAEAAEAQRLEAAREQGRREAQEAAEIERIRREHAANSSPSFDAESLKAPLPETYRGERIAGDGAEHAPREPAETITANVGASPTVEAQQRHAAKVVAAETLQLECELTEEQARAVVRSIAAGHIPHLSITY